jgi:hypothetical protein
MILVMNETSEGNCQNITELFSEPRPSIGGFEFYFSSFRAENF